eukprot:1142942-Pelagomonas_calceolata.AAC.4
MPSFRSGGALGGPGQPAATSAATTIRQAAKSALDCDNSSAMGAFPVRLDFLRMISRVFPQPPLQSALEYMLLVHLLLVSNRNQMQDGCFVEANEACWDLALPVTILTHPEKIAVCHAQYMQIATSRAGALCSLTTAIANATLDPVGISSTCNFLDILYLIETFRIKQRQPCRDPGCKGSGLEPARPKEQ